MYIKKFYNLIRLMRINQPIGFFLLLWPTLWGLWFANDGKPNFSLVTLFVTGVVCMRSAGCIINDYIDYDIDGHVQRTKYRPLIDGTVLKKEALLLFVILLIISAFLVFMLNFTTISLSLIALVLSIIYPFLKKYIYFPQLVLGIVFSCPILMAFTAVNHSINQTAWLLFIANTIWTISYDTQYSMIDRNDDINIALKSSAILFRNLDTFIIGILQFIMILILIFLAWTEKLSILFYIFAILGTTMAFVWQQKLIYNRNQERCFQAFLNNNYVGLLVFIGIVLHFYKI